MGPGIFTAAATTYQWSDSLRERYGEKHYVVLEDFVTSRQIRRLFDARSQCLEKVYTGADGGSVWKTHHVDEGHWLERDVLESPLIDRLNGITGSAIHTRKTKIWYMDYGVGEFVERHADFNWTLVLLICLRGVAKENGGSLHLCVGEQEDHIHLTDGRAVAFSGLTVHYTTPLVPSSAVPDPLRTCLAISFL